MSFAWRDEPDQLCPGTAETDLLNLTIVISKRYFYSTVMKFRCVCARDA